MTPIMRAIHIVGRKNHGKTTLVCELLTEFSRRGLRVGSVKHCGHEHELDTPGTDSHHHRRAGAARVLVVARNLTALYSTRSADQDPAPDIAVQFSDCDLVLIEGWINGPGPKVEVWRRGMGDAPLATTRTDIRAVVSDDAPLVTVPVWPRADIGVIARQLLTVAESFPKGGGESPR